MVDFKGGLCGDTTGIEGQSCYVTVTFRNITVILRFRTELHYFRVARHNPNAPNKMTQLAAVQECLRDCKTYVLFDASGTVLASNYQPQSAELQALTKVLDDRDTAIKSGMTIDGQRFEVHRFHPPLAYGRSMGCAPESSVGAALCKVDRGVTGAACFGAITYTMPNLSARMVPILQQVCEQQLAAKS